MNGIRRRLLNLLSEEDLSKDRRKYNYADVVMWDSTPNHTWNIYINGWNYVANSYFHLDDEGNKVYHPVIGISLVYRSPLNGYRKIILNTKAASCKTPLTGSTGTEGIKFGAPLPASATLFNEKTDSPVFLKKIPVVSEDGKTFSEINVSVKEKVYASSDYFYEKKMYEKGKTAIDDPNDSIGAFSTEAVDGFVSTPITGEQNIYSLPYMDGNAPDANNPMGGANAFSDFLMGSFIRHQYLSPQITVQGWSTNRIPIDNVSDAGNYPAYCAAKLMTYPDYDNGTKIWTERGLPSLGELLLIFSRQASIKHTLKKLLMDDIFNDNWFWSCTPYDETHTWAVNFGTGEIAPKLNSDECCVIGVQEGVEDEHTAIADICLYHNNKLTIVPGDYYIWSRKNLHKDSKIIGYVGHEDVKKKEAMVYSYAYIDINNIAGQNGKDGMTTNLTDDQRKGMFNGGTGSKVKKYRGIAALANTTSEKIPETNASYASPTATNPFYFPLQNMSLYNMSSFGSWSRKLFAGKKIRFNLNGDALTSYIYKESKNSYFIASPYYKDMYADNPNFFQESFTAGTTQPLPNALSAKGKVDTQSMWDELKEKYGSVPESTKPNDTIIPAATAIYNYSIDGTKKGDWYIPSIGELAYLPVRMRQMRKANDCQVGSDFLIQNDTGNNVICSSTMKDENTFYAMRFMLGDGPQIVTVSASNNEFTRFIGATTITDYVKPVTYADLLVYDSQEKEKMIVNGEQYNLLDYPKDRYTPIGIVLMTPKESGDDYYRVISIPIMDPARPEIGVISDSRNIAFGVENNPSGMESFDSLPIVSDGTKLYDTVQSTDTYGHFPSDGFVSNQELTVLSTDGFRLYYGTDYDHYLPTWFKADGSMNNVLTDALPNGKKNALSDKDGYANTQKILSQTIIQKNWKTDEIIKSRMMKGYYPAACAAWRFHTPGTEQGDWYIPSAYEASFLLAHKYGIQETLFKLGYRKYSWTSNLWTSTMYDKNTSFAIMDNGLKPVDNRQNLRALAMLKFKQKGTGPKDYADVVFYDKDTKKFHLVNGADVDNTKVPSSKYAPVGVVAIPGSHNDDESVTVMGLHMLDVKNFEVGITNKDTYPVGIDTNTFYSIPKYIDNGANNVQSPTWNVQTYANVSTGNDSTFETFNYGGQDLGLPTGDTIATIRISNDFIQQNPLWGNDAKLKNQLDPVTSYLKGDTTDNYKYITSPYGKDSISKSSIFEKTSDGHLTAPGLAATEEFTGKATMKAWIAVQTTTDYQTSTEQTGDPWRSAWRYYTTGTNKGDWYLPTIRDAIYMLSRSVRISSSLTKVQTWLETDKLGSINQMPMHTDTDKYEYKIGTCSYCILNGSVYNLDWYSGNIGDYSASDSALSRPQVFYPYTSIDKSQIDNYNGWVW